MKGCILCLEIEFFYQEMDQAELKFEIVIKLQHGTLTCYLVPLKPICHSCSACSTVLGQVSNILFMLYESLKKACRKVLSFPENSLSVLLCLFFWLKVQAKLSSRKKSQFSRNQ